LYYTHVNVIFIIIMLLNLTYCSDPTIYSSTITDTYCVYLLIFIHIDNIEIDKMQL